MEESKRKENNIHSKEQHKYSTFFVPLLLHTHIYISLSIISLHEPPPPPPPPPPTHTLPPLRPFFLPVRRQLAGGQLAGRQLAGGQLAGDFFGG